MKSRILIIIIVYLFLYLLIGRFQKQIFHSLSTKFGFVLIAKDKISIVFFVPRWMLILYWLKLNTNFVTDFCLRICI